MIILPTVTDYRGHRQTLFPVQEINLKAYADAILTQITWPALEFESRAMHRQPAKPSAYRAKPRGQGLCGLLNACCRVTITYRHTDTADSAMFSLSLMLRMFDIRCVNRPNSTSQEHECTAVSVRYVTVQQVTGCRLHSI